MSLVDGGAEVPCVVLIEALDERPAWQLQLFERLLDGRESPGGLLSAKGPLFTSRADRVHIELSVLDALGTNATRGQPVFTPCNLFNTSIARLIHSLLVLPSPRAGRPSMGAFLEGHPSFAPPCLLLG